MSASRTCLEEQVGEAEVLAAMLPGPGEFALVDPAVLVDARAYLADPSSGPAFPASIAFDLRLTAVQTDVHVRFPPLYPLHASPEVTLRPPPWLPRAAAQRLVDGTISAMAAMQGDCAVWAGLTWLLHEGAVVMAEEKALQAQQAQQRRDRQQKRHEAAPAYKIEAFWFHHIYNRHKRQLIQEHAAELQLTGFCLPGKPGIVVVEGEAGDVAEFYVRVRRLPWQRMSSRYARVEPCASQAALEKQRAFRDFGELVSPHSSGGTHSDLALARAALEAGGLGAVFSALRGVAAGDDDAAEAECSDEEQEK